MILLCEKCNVEVILCPATWPWDDEYWICPVCEEKYSGEDE